MQKKTLHRTSLLLCLFVFVSFFVVVVLLNEKMHWVEWRESIQPAQTDEESVPNSAHSGGKDTTLLPPVHRDLQPAYEIDAVLDADQQTIQGTLGVTFDNPKTQRIRFYLYDYQGYELNIEEIRFPHEATDFVRKPEMVSFKNTFRARGRISVEIDFTVPVPQQGTRFGVKNNVWLFTNWYPMLGMLNREGDWFQPVTPVGYGDPFLYTYGDYIVHLTAPASFEWVSSGRFANEREQDYGRVKKTWEADDVLTFSLVGSPDYHVRETVIGDLNVSIALPNASRFAQVERIVAESVRTFQETYGPLPYSHVSVAQTPRGTNYALEYPNLAIFSKDMYDANQVEHWLPHEIGHLWWYNAVHPNEPYHGWIDEGLAEWSVYLYEKQRYGVETAERSLDRYKRLRRNAARRYPQGSLGRPLVEFRSQDEFSQTWYGTSVVVFQQLQNQIGKEAFRTFLQKLLADYGLHVIDAKHLDDVLSRVMGEPTRYFTLNEQRLNDEALLSYKASVQDASQTTENEGE